MIFLPKYIYMLVALEDKGTTLSKLQHKIKLTYAHASNIKKELIKRELVFEKKRGMALSRSRCHPIPFLPSLSLL